MYLAAAHSVLPEQDDVLCGKAAAFVVGISGTSTLPPISVVNAPSFSQPLKNPPNPLALSRMEALGHQSGVIKSLKEVVLDSCMAHSDSKLWALSRA